MNNVSLEIYDDEIIIRARIPASMRSVFMNNTEAEIVEMSRQYDPNFDILELKLLIKHG